ncbi:MAG: DUF927 domain-containing protein [Alistipes sp.]|nr:DUF927 domain-containing protein [Alistipes sp.]
MTEYTKEDFDTPAPYEELLAIANPFERNIATAKMAEYAESIKVKGFKTRLKLYRESVASESKANRVIAIDAQTAFTGQPMELATGQWKADDFGVTKGFGSEEAVVCPHPIMPIGSLVNVDTGVEKVKIAYCKGDRRWRTIVVDRKTVASRQKIIDLADVGIAVTSENSADLVRYLADVETLNYDILPSDQSTSRLGWIPDAGFAPYVDDLVFDGELSFKKMYAAVTPKGKEDKWMDAVKAARRHGVIFRIVLAASFASPLIELFDALPFFVHLWGGAGSGKTVGLMLAASVWANPAMGEYVHSFNSTSVGHEMKAGFLNSLPLILDELQVLKNKTDTDQLIYQLCEGVGRSRGAKSGGLQHTLSWRNCIITTGEQPIITHNSGTGAALRVVEIDCKDEKLFTDPRGTLAVVRKNYGHAGKKFIGLLERSDVLEFAHECQRDFYGQITGRCDVEDKQAMSASLLLTADALIEKYFFSDGIRLGVDDIAEYLVTKSQSNANERAYDWLLDFIACNPARFSPNEHGEYVGECWGCIDDTFAYINKTIFDSKMLEAGYNPQAFLSWAKRNDLIRPDGKQFARLKRIYHGAQRPTRCIWLKLPLDEGGYCAEG